MSPEIRDVAKYVHAQKGGGTITINSANHMITVLQDGAVYLGTLDEPDDIEYGETTGGLLDDSVSFDDL